MTVPNLCFAISLSKQNYFPCSFWKSEHTETESFELQGWLPGLKGEGDSEQLPTIAIVANYDTLVATAKTKQAAAQSAVNELKALDVTIDCTQPDPASTVATLKAAVQKARSALQDYRASIKDVVVALKGASTSTSDSTNTEGNQ